MAVLIYFKGCQICRGDLSLQIDIHGSYWSCLSCGRMIDLNKDGTPAVPISDQKVPHRKAVTQGESNRQRTSKMDKPTTREPKKAGGKFNWFM